MAKSHDKDLLPVVKNTLMSLLDDSSLDLQIFLSVIAFVAAFLGSIVIERIIRRKLKVSPKYTDIINSIISSVLLPFMVIMSLVAASWITSALMPALQTHVIIASLVKIALVWLIASGILLIAHKHFIAYFINSIMLAMTLLSVTGLLQPALDSFTRIAFDLGKFRISLLDILKGIFTLVILFWGAGALSKSGENWLKRSHLSFNARELAIKFLRITLYFLAFLFSLTEMGVDLTALTVFGGALAVALGFGLQKITSNFLSGIILLFEKAIEAGDLIEVGTEKGWVRQMAIRHTLIETFDGREVLVPNEELIIGKVTNWTYTNTRGRIDISLIVTYDADVELAQKLMIEAAKSHPLCISEPHPAANLREFGERGILIMLTFWIPDVTQGMVSSRSQVMIKIIHSFRTTGIKFAQIN